MSKKHLDLAVRYVNAGVVTELAIKAQEMASSLRGDIDHLKDTMLAADAGIGIYFDELTALYNHLSDAEELLVRCERAGRNISQEMRKTLTELA
ncbi:hypothetical protein [Enterobacter bugandensis]|uniref:hypothetical protein n=1 Tax=Enterobacter bugandensis TaxID=881260 RepID=UPI001F30477F|nr:hypothetical protein [Enterobacter bugandensis]MCK6943731.1 hypothetical protein [Enterobacter bugandensis]MCK7422847.1 hypothetical protein [Enterobacter bugandensis]MCK7432849.1 hypothetical protein [Enterobacter bugandensis]MEA5252102.1 hypothetical protein [Enterobacter bugandensis]